MENDKKEWSRLIRESLPTETEKEERLGKEYRKGEDPSNFVTTLDKTKVLPGIIDLRIKCSVAGTRKEVLRTTSANNRSK